MSLLLRCNLVRIVLLFLMVEKQRLRSAVLASNGHRIPSAINLASQNAELSDFRLLGTLS